ncbi:hypothetical protein [Kutzneria sp. NPDC051319]|uniref:hypothetical protein n=1 Tax=Kutzneria sp. NPDC051319 TaxID=3155047 RepID=UPI003441A266
MSRSWQSYRLHTHHWPDQVDLLVSHLQAADAGARWRFERGAVGVDLWVHATNQAGDALRAVGGARPGDRRPPVTDHAGREAELAATLASLSSELALGLVRDSELPTTAVVPTAALHLATVLGLLPEPARLPFLFQCWQEWSSPLPPAARVALGIRADRYAPSVVDDVALLGGGPWDRYRHAIREQCDIGPDLYLLFDHTLLTHDRIGIGRPDGALAARALRALLTTGATLPSAATPAAV